MTLRISEGLLEEFLRHGESAFPAECCGALAGRVQGNGDKEVVRLAPAVNRRTDDPHRYLIAPDDLRRLETDLRADGLDRALRTKMGVLATSGRPRSRSMTS